MKASIGNGRLAAWPERLLALFSVSLLYGWRPSAASARPWLAGLRRKWLWRQLILVKRLACGVPLLFSGWPLADISAAGGSGLAASSPCNKRRKRYNAVRRNWPVVGL